jgi:hypothetical protein
MWEMLIKEDGGKGYTVDNVHVLFGENGNDFTFPLQWERYTAIHNYEPYVVDDNSNYQTIDDLFEDNLANTITEDDFLFVWIMGHGGSDATGHYFYSYDNHKIYDYELAGWLDGIAAHKKTVFLSFPKSGGFVPELEAAGNIVITACGATEGASRADDMAPGGAFIENEVRSNITYNHGEINYHLFSSLTGKTPKGEDQYAGTDLDLADLNSDNYIAINETWTWTSGKETLNGESPVCSDLGNIKTSTELEYPTLLYQGVSGSVLASCRGLIGITKDMIFNNGDFVNFRKNAKVFILNTLQLFSFDGSTVVIEDNVTFSNNNQNVWIWLHTQNNVIGDNVRNLLLITVQFLAI